MDTRLIVGFFGNVFAFFLFLAPAVTFKTIITNKSTGQFSGVPYVMTLLNNILSAWYGLPSVSKHNILVTRINVIGAVIESAYILVFLILAPKKEKLKIGGLLVFILSIFAVVACVSLALDDHERNISCGIVASVCSIIMYGSPLSVMMSVIRTESVEYMPFFLSLFSFLCGTSWFIFGLLGNDLYLYVPNGFGCALGAMQLILYYKYYDKNGSGKSTT